MSRSFFHDIIPRVMWRLATFPYLGSKLLHYFKEGSKDVLLYDVIKKIHTRFRIDWQIPYGCKTITVDKENTYLLGGPECKSTWNFNTRNRIIISKKDMK